MNTKTSNFFFAAIMLMTLAATFSTSAFGQRLSTTNVSSADPYTVAVEAPVYPHDFSDAYYIANGVNPSAIRYRLTGMDHLSVIEKTAHPNYSHVRALVTLPAHTVTSDATFWNPFGTLNVGDVKPFALDLASRHLVYVFPTPSMKIGGSPFGDMRQAVVFDEPAGYSDVANPLGLRLIVRVNFVSPRTSKGKVVLEQMAAVNGRTADGMPIVKSATDISTLSIYGLIQLSKGEIAIAPVIDTKDGIAKDAFLSHATNGGKPLDGELNFFNKFQCLKDKTC